MGKLINNLRRVFNESLNGGLVTTGNTCAVVGDVNNKIKEFIKPTGEYTVDWHEIGSSSYLEIPKNSKMRFAILEWHSVIRTDDSVEHYLPIHFETPTQTTMLAINRLSSDEAFFEDTYKHSVKWVDVSNLVKESGYYTVKGIPTNILEKEVKDLRNHNKSIGWSLTVVYENEKMPLRSICVYVGIKNCSYDIKRINSYIELTGFTVPKIPKSAFLNIVASNGDTNMYCGINVYEDIKDLNNIKNFIGNEMDSSYENEVTGSIMPYDNIFSGIIMNTNTESLDYGKIEVRGTLGEKNNFPFNVLKQHKFKGNRGKLDVLTFDISDKISSYQEKIILEPYMDFIPTGSPNIIVCGLQIDNLNNNCIENDIVKIFNEELKGGLITIGNSCSVIGDVNNKIKEFIKPTGEYTSNFNEIGSSSYLEIPENSKVKFAVLEWHSTVENRDKKLTLKEEYNEITFITPKGEKKISINITDKTQAFYKDMFSNNKESVKWIEVTDLVKEGKEGFYTLKGIKTLILKDKAGNLENHEMSIGWSLNVIYENDKSPFRQISLYMGIKNQSYYIKKIDRSINIDIKKFSKDKKVYLNLVSSNGNPNMYSGINIYNSIENINNIDKKYYLGSDLDSANIQYGDELIPYDNAFSGIIMNTNIESKDYRKIETRGTLGDKNNSAFGIINQDNFKGNRGKLDILSFDVSNKILQNQEKLILALDLHKIPSNYPNIISLGMQIEL